MVLLRVLCSKYYILKYAYDEFAILKTACLFYFLLPLLKITLKLKLKNFFEFYKYEKTFFLHFVVLKNNTIISYIHTMTIVNILKKYILVIDTDVLILHIQCAVFLKF